MSNLEFVNHSCLILSHNGVSLAMDPWIEGSVFNNSWDLLSKTKEKSIESLKKSDFIWFSHEHPDHFNPPNLKIFSDKNNFLFQKTIDGRVVNFLKKISPKVNEIHFKDIFRLGKDFTIQVVPFQYLDSMSIIKINNLTILNLNDCDLKNEFQLKFIKDLTGPIDILLVQFSYAIGKSNRYNNNEREKWSIEILQKLSNNIKFLKPKTVIPFASFCYFSKHDNFYMNDSSNKIDKTIEYLSKENPNVKFLCFYPGDKWDLNSDFSNINSFNKYNEDYKKINILPNHEKLIHFNTLKTSSNNFIEITKKKNSLFNFYRFFNINKYKIFFKLTDLNKNYFFDFNNGLVEHVDLNTNKPWCSLTSQSLNNLFTSGYGYDALIIGGRFECNKLGLNSLNKIFKFQAKNYQNIYYNINTILSNFLKKIFKTTKIFHTR
tara:strand:- start:173 stop:1471 length:1299 start_codon:yes stop_codon:yes gene_type:complete